MIRRNAAPMAAMLLGIVNLMGLSPCAAEVAETPRGTLQAVRVAAMPAIDGTADDPLWGKSPVLVLGPPESQEPHQARTTTARVLFAPGHVCVLVQCLDGETGALKADAKGHDGQVWLDDCVELFISPDVQEFGYLHMAVNPRGTVFDQRFRGFMGDARFNTKAGVAASVQEGKGWTVSMAVPFSELEAAAGENQTWRLNITRTEPRSARESSWATLADDDSHRPDCFGSVRGVPILPEEGRPKPSSRPVVDTGIREGDFPEDILTMYEWDFDRPDRDYFWEGFRETGKTWNGSAGAARAPRSLALSASLSGALCNLPSAVVRRYDHSRLTRNRYFGLAYYVEDISALTLKFYNASQHVTMTMRIEPARQKSWTRAWFNLLHNVSGGSPFPSSVRLGDRLTKVTIQGEPSGKNPVLILDEISVFERQDVDVALPEQRVLPATAFNRVGIRAYTTADAPVGALTATIPPLPAGKDHAVTFVYDHPVRPAPDLWEAKKLSEYAWKGTWLLRGHDPEALKRIPELEELGMEIGGVPASAYDLNSYSYARDLEEAVTGRLALRRAATGPVLAFENCDDTRRESYVPFWAGTFCMRAARDAGYLIQPTWGKYCYLEYYPRLHWYRDIATAAIQLYADRPGPRAPQNIFYGRPHEAYGWEENYSQPVTGSREFYGKMNEFDRANQATNDKFRQLLYRIRHWDLGKVVILKSLGVEPGARAGFEEVLKGYSGKKDVWYASLGEIGTYEYLKSRCRVVPDASAASAPSPGEVPLALEMADCRPDWVRQDLSVALKTDAQIKRVEVEGESVPLRKRPGETAFDIPLKFLRRQVIRAGIATKREIISAPDSEEITLSLTNPTDKPVSVEVHWTAPPEWGWKLSPLKQGSAIGLAGGESTSVSYRLATAPESGFGLWPLTARLKITSGEAVVYQYVTKEVAVAPMVTADVSPYLPVFLRPGSKVRVQLVLDRSVQMPTHSYSAFEGKRTIPRFVCQGEKKPIDGVVRVAFPPAFKVIPAEQRVTLPPDQPVRVDFMVENVAAPADVQVPFRFLPTLELEGRGAVGLALDATDIYVDKGSDYKPLDERGLVFHAPFDGKGEARCVGAPRVVLRKDIDNDPKVQPKPPTWVEGKRGQALAVSAAWYDAEKHFNALEGTALFWFKQPKEAQEEHCCILMVGGNVTGSWYICRLVLHKGNLSFSYVFLGNEEHVVQTPWPGDQAWHAVGVVWNSYGKCLQLYVDGRLAAEEEGGRGEWLMMPLQSSRHFRDFPGWKHYYKSEYEGTLRGADLEVFFKWKAKPSAIDELYLFDRALSADEIRRHIEGGN